MENHNVSFDSVLSMDKQDLSKFLLENSEYNNTIFKSAQEKSQVSIGATKKRYRVFFFVAWLPIGRNSSHIRSLLNIVEIYQSRSIECTFIITGMEFTHHRGLSFYLDKTFDELNRVFRSVFKSINPVNLKLLNIEYAVSKDSGINDVNSQRNRVIEIFEKYNFNSNDLLFCITGILSCRFCHAYLAKYNNNVVAFAHNAKDNLGYLSSYASHVVMPSLRSPDLLNDLKNKCHENCSIHENIAPSKPFNWQLTVDGKRSIDELEVISKIKQKNSVILISANARFNDVEPSFFKFFEIVKRAFPDINFIYLLVGFDVDKPSKFKALSENGFMTLAWTDDLYNLISELKNYGKTIYCYPSRTDSGGSNRMAYLAKVPTMVFDTNDAVSAIPDETVVKDLSEFNLKLARYFFDDNFYENYENRIKGHDLNLRQKAEILFMSFFSSNWSI